MRTHQFERPRGARGILPLLAIAAGAKAAGAIYGAINSNQTKQRNKGYLSAAYRSGVQRQETLQQDTRQATSESLNARGLLSGGVSPIHAAMAPAGGRKEVGTSGVLEALAPQTEGATDLAGGVQVRNEREFGIERNDLDNQYKRDINENNAAGLNGELGSIAGGIEGVAGAVSAAQGLSAANAAATGASGTRTPIASALLSGSAYGGIHATDPLGDPSSAWHVPRGGTVVGMGQSNAEFNTGAG
jgi:hypothetical protein